MILALRFLPSQSGVERIGIVVRLNDEQHAALAHLLLSLKEDMQTVTFGCSIEARSPELYTVVGQSGGRKG